MKIARPGETPAARAACGSRVNGPHNLVIRYVNECRSRVPGGFCYTPRFLVAELGLREAQPPCNGTSRVFTANG